MKDLNTLFNSKWVISSFAWFLVVAIAGVNSSLLFSDDRDLMPSVAGYHATAKPRKLFNESLLKEKIQQQILNDFKTYVEPSSTDQSETCLKWTQSPANIFPVSDQPKTVVKETLAYYKCVIGKIGGETYDFYYKVLSKGESGKRGADVTFALKKDDSTLSHDAEFVMKSTFSGGISDSENNLEFEAITKQLKPKFDEFLNHIKLTPDDTLKTKILEILDKLLVPADTESSMKAEVIRIYPIKKMVCLKRNATGNPPKCSIEKQTMFEMRIEKSASKKGMADVFLQLGSMHFRAAIPLFGTAQPSESQFDKVMKDFEKGVTKWINETPEQQYQLVELNHALKIISDAFAADTNGCFELIPSPNSDKELYNYFEKKAKIKKSQSQACKSTDTFKIPDEINILFFSYQFGYTAFGHLRLDSIYQTAEFLVDLNESNFSKTVNQEIKDYIEEIKITLSDSKASTPALTLEAIANYINNSNEKISCPIDNQNKDGKNPKSAKIICNAKDSQNQKLVEITEIQSPEFVFKVKFFFNKAAAAQGAVSLTNQIVLQKFNTFNQLLRLEPSIKLLSS